MIHFSSTRDVDPDAPVMHVHRERLNDAETVLDFLRNLIDPLMDKHFEAFRAECAEHDLFYELTPGPNVFLSTEDEEENEGTIVVLRGNDAVLLLQELWSLPTSGVRFVALLYNEFMPRGNKKRPKGDANG